MLLTTASQWRFRQELLSHNIEIRGQGVSNCPRKGSSSLFFVFFLRTRPERERDIYIIMYTYIFCIFAHHVYILIYIYTHNIYIYLSICKKDIYILKNKLYIYNFTIDMYIYTYNTYIHLQYINKYIYNKIHTYIYIYAQIIHNINNIYAIF